MARMFISYPRSRRRVSDWIKLRTGDTVYDVGDERHVGTVVAIFSGSTAAVVWNDTGWRSEVAIERLRRIK